MKITKNIDIDFDIGPNGEILAIKTIKKKNVTKSQPIVMDENFFYSLMVRHFLAKEKLVKEKYEWGRIYGKHAFILKLEVMSASTYKQIQKIRGEKQ